MRIPLLCTLDAFPTFLYPEFNFYEVFLRAEVIFGKFPESKKFLSNDSNDVLFLGVSLFVGNSR